MLGRLSASFVVSAILHIALATGVYIALTNDVNTQVKPKQTPIKLTMFAPVVKPVIVPKAINKVTPKPKIKAIKEVVTPAPVPVKKEKLVKKLETPSTPASLAVIKKIEKIKKPTKKKIKKKTKKKIVKKIARKKPKRKAIAKAKPRASQKPAIKRAKSRPHQPAKKQYIQPKLAVKHRQTVRPKKRLVAKQKPISKQSTRPKAAQFIDNQHINRFKQSLKRAIDQNKRYPMSSRRRNQQGKAIVAFTLMRDGSIKNIRTVHSSGFKKLDRAAIKAVKAIHRKLPIPNQINKMSWNFSVPILFGLK